MNTPNATYNNTIFSLGSRTKKLLACPVLLDGPNGTRPNNDHQPEVGTSMEDLTA